MQENKGNRSRIGRQYFIYWAGRGRCSAKTPPVDRQGAKGGNRAMYHVFLPPPPLPMAHIRLGFLAVLLAWRQLGRFDSSGS